jgi:hypothetical protein
VVENAGHMAMLERPAEVNHDLRVFARQVLGLDRERRARQKASGQKTSGQKTSGQKAVKKAVGENG